MKIRFGTDGWRGIIAEDFTFAGVEKVALAIGRFLGRDKDKIAVVVGYDTRFLGREFALRAAAVLNSLGIVVYLGSTPHPTPVVAAGILEQKLDGALVFTASHNPACYNGIKFIPHNGAPAGPEVTEAIEGELENINGGEIPKMDPEKAAKEGLLRDWDGRKNYLQRLEQVVDGNLLRENPTRVIINPLFGAGRGYLEEFLGEKGWTCEIRDGHRDPCFGGQMPDPSRQRLAPLSQEIIESSALLGLGLDGDGDRFGIIDRDGSFIDPNQFLFISAFYLLEGRGLQGNIARSVATTHLLDRIAEKFGRQVLETPVGFKYLGKLLTEGEVFLAGEESGGLGLASHLPEKDGILACLLACEIISFYGVSLGEVLNQAREKYGGMVSRRFDISFPPGQRGRLLKAVNELEPGQLDGREVVERKTGDGVKLIMGDGAWILIRPSGTEDLFRMYVEAEKQSSIELLADEVRSFLRV